MAFFGFSAPYPERFYSPSLAHKNLKNPSGIFIWSLVGFFGLIVHTLKEVNEQLQKGHFFFKDIREQGILLYNANGKELVEPENLTEAERREIAQGHFDHWFKSADEFLFGYGIYLERGSLAIAAFNLHQATERFFACLLLTFTNYLPKTHNIEKLKKYCAEQDIAFAAIFPMDEKFHRRSFRRLQRAAVFDAL